LLYLYRCSGMVATVVGVDGSQNMTRYQL